MVNGLIVLVSVDTWLIVAVLVTCNIINVILIKERRLKKREKVAISLLSTSIISSTATSLYSHYALEPLHILNHTLFKAAYIFGMLILIQGNLPIILTVAKTLYNLVEVNVFDQLNNLLPKIGLAGAKSLYNLVEVNVFNQLNNLLPKIGLARAKSLYNLVEVNVFNQLNNLLARITIKIAKIVRRIQTGKLTTNILMILIFFLLYIIIIIIPIIFMSYISPSSASIT